MARERLAEVEVLVVGGGPAGALAAFILSRSGRDVLLLEQRREGAGKVCGEYLSAEGAAVLRRWGILPRLLDAGAARILRTRIVAAGGGWFDCPLPGEEAAPGLGLSRRLLDAELLGAARAAGASLATGARLTALSRQGDRWRAEVRTGAESWQVLSRLVVGADGRNSRVAALARLPGRFHAAGIGLQVHYRREAPAPDRVDLFLLPGGYAGVAPIENDRWCLGALLPSPESSRGPFHALQRSLFGSALPEESVPALGEALDRTASFPVRVGSRRAVRHGIFLAGDAACMVDPFLGQGISLALMGGEAAAEALLETIAGRVRAGEKGYRRFLRREVHLRAVVASGLRRLISHPYLTRQFVRQLARHPSAGRALVALTRNSGAGWLRVLPRVAGRLALP